MSSSSSRRNYPIETLQFKNQACNRCGRNAVIKISGSINNPRKAYFKCIECDNFVMWLGEEHVLMSKPLECRDGRSMVEIGEASSGREDNSDHILEIKKEIVEFHSCVKLVSKFYALMLFAILLVILLK
ncbi:hypothetical protein RND81_10G049600 [Saponaria officinalis]|uniref:Zinc finger GRF-type domain-containing protein n=1 Tax=Saponaria officinalis TaxID=3572 RepID=A0AAW1HY42_SAPOF